MAYSWQRLIDGTFVQSDIRLLVHEYAESLIAQGNTIDIGVAHEIVNAIADGKYNWSDFFSGEL